jgi:hypothetical protein
LCCVIGLKQGDQIGLTFAHWAFVFFGYFFENERAGLNFYLHLNLCIKLNEKWLGCTLGDFFANSSGHPGTK